MERQYVIFNLADEFYGVNIATVESIIKVQDITRMPHMPAFIEGITNLRGKVIPVIDLRKRFRLPAAEEDDDTRIVVVEIDGIMAGMVVDRVTEVLRISDEDIDPPSPMVSTVSTAFITSIAKVEARLIILLDLGKILTIEEQGSLQSSIA